MRLRRRGGASDEGGGADLATDQMPQGEAQTEAGGTRRRRRPLRAAATPGPGTGDGPETGATEVPEQQARTSSSKGSKGWMQKLMAEQVAASRDEAERDAARELRQFMAPAMDQLVLNVPGSKSAEEAEATLARQSAVELEKPVEVRPEAVIDLRNPPDLRAYPPDQKLSNRVLRLANRHWAQGKQRPSAEVVAEKSALFEEEFARKPIGTQRCLAERGSLRCRGVFAFNSEERAGSLLRCPTCQVGHVWDESEAKWTVIDVPEVGKAPPKRALTSPS